MHTHGGRRLSARRFLVRIAKRGTVFAAGALVLGVAGPALFSGASASSGLTSPNPTCTDQWTMYQHDPSHHAAPDCRAINPSTVSTLVPAWLFQTSQPVTASPIVSGGQVYVGDSGGTFHDINQATGKEVWHFTVSPGVSYQCAITGPGVDQHVPSYGEITSSAMVATVPNGETLVYFGAGGSLFALDAANGSCQWAVNLDPSNPTSALEEESSPVFRPSGNGGPAEVITGSDGNENPGGSGPPGLQAFEAQTGSLLWKYEPENDTTVKTLTSNEAADTNGCGDVWSSPALDIAQNLVVLTTGNCPNGSASPGVADSPATCPGAPATPPSVQGIAALNATTGCRVWRWTEPNNQYSNPNFADGGDTDIGSSPILATIDNPTTGLSDPVVIDGSKSGYMYALDETTTNPAGNLVWSNQIAQPGQTGAALAGAIGGFIGSSALGLVDGSQTVFGTTAIPAPFSADGVQFGPPPTASLDTTLICVDISSGTPALDLKHCDPLRIASLHAVDANTGNVKWQALTALPSYAATTTANGVVFAPSTTGFSIVAYSGETGLPLWGFPTGGAMSSGAAVVGSDVIVGAGTSEQIASPLPSIPPDQVNGVWCFTLASGLLP